MYDAEYLYLVALNTVGDDVWITAMHLFARTLKLSESAELRMLCKSLCFLTKRGDDTTRSSRIVTGDIFVNQPQIIEGAGEVAQAH